MSLFTMVQDSVIVDLYDPLVKELGERVVEDMFYENYQVPMIKYITISGRAARATNTCSVCYERPVSARSYLPGTCSPCGYSAHVEGY